MFLSDLFKTLSVGDFSNLAVGGRDIDGIPAEEYPRLISYLNLALTDIHIRFPLKQEEVIIQLEDWIMTYTLSREYAQTNDESNQPIKYVMDSPFRPFKDNVLKIEKVYKENGVEVPINNEALLDSVYTFGHRTLKIPYAQSENVLMVLYRANHEKLPEKTSIDPEEIELDIPDFMVEPIMAYMYHRHLKGMGGADNFNQANAALAHYNLLCDEITARGLIIPDSTSNTKLEMNGWV